MLQLRDFQNVCPDDLTAALALQVYNDLKRDERCGHLQPHYDDDLKVFYLRKEDTQAAYIPLMHTKGIHFSLVEAMQDKFGKNNIFLAIVDNTGNILYYQVTEGFSEKKF